MLCTKCNGQLLEIDDGIVQCQNCKAKFRVKKKVNTTQTTTDTNQTNNLSSILNIDTTKPFSLPEQRSSMEDFLQSLRFQPFPDKHNDNDLIELELIEGDEQDKQNENEANLALADYDKKTYHLVNEEIITKCPLCGEMLDENGYCKICNKKIEKPLPKTMECPVCHYKANNLLNDFCYKCNTSLVSVKEQLGVMFTKQNVSLMIDYSTMPQKPKKEKFGLNIFSLMFLIVSILIPFMIKNFYVGTQTSITLDNLVTLAFNSSKDFITSLGEEFAFIENNKLITLLLQISVLSLVLFIVSSIVNIMECLVSILTKKNHKVFALKMVFFQFVCAIAILISNIFIFLNIENATYDFVNYPILILLGTIVNLFITFSLPISTTKNKDN